MGLVGGIIIALLGLFCLLAAIKQWKFFFNHYRARSVSNVLGAKGARVFYFLLGAFFLFIGIMTIIQYFFPNSWLVQLVS